MFNTLRYARVLESAGVSREQAEAHVQIMAEIVEDNLATKEDIRQLEQKLDHKIIQLEYRLTLKIGTMIAASVAAITTFFKFF